MGESDTIRAFTAELLDRKYAEQNGIRYQPQRRKDVVGVGGGGGGGTGGGGKSSKGGGGDGWEKIAAPANSQGSQGGGGGEGGEGEEGGRERVRRPDGGVIMRIRHLPRLCQTFTDNVGRRRRAVCHRLYTRYTATLTIGTDTNCLLPQRMKARGVPNTSIQPRFATAVTNVSGQGIAMVYHQIF